MNRIALYEAEADVTLMLGILLGCLLGLLPAVALADSTASPDEMKQEGPSGRPDTSAQEPREQLTGSFIRRLFTAYMMDPPAAVDLPRRLPPAPFSSPPFPMSEHIGPVIGALDSTPNNLPLMKALSDHDIGKVLRGSRINVYGWIVPSFNASTSQDTNIPLTYQIVPNSAQLSQAVVIMERGLDTEQTSHLDWGFRFTNLYGMDYRYTAAKGIFGGQLLDRNQLYGYDPMEFYGQVYVPWVAQGMVVKVGRFMSPADIEAQLAPNNYLVTHSVMFSYDPFTFTGILAAVRLTPQWTIELGVHGGNDMAAWSESAQPNGHAMVKWLSDDNKDAIWVGANSVGTGQYTKGHDNLQHMVGVWSHRFNDTFHMMSEAYYIYQFDAAKGGTCILGPTRPFASGGGCGPTIPGLSDSIGAVNYFQIKLSDKDYVTIRNDVLVDLKGQRTGFKTVYSSHTVGWSHWLTNALIVRPELRYDHSWSHVTPYDNGTRKDQFVFLTDFIIKF